MFSRAFVLWSAVVAVGCHRSSPTTDASPGASATTGADGSAVALEEASLERAWVEARGADPLELARLANLEGVHKLAEVAANEHASVEDRATAIRAIAFTPDPTPALDALTKLVIDPSEERSTLALQTLAHVAPKRAPIEELEPGAWRTCGDGLLTALKTIQGAVRRELAITTLRALVDRGAVNAALIPAR
jgi:hypothetical protein